MELFSLAHLMSPAVLLCLLASLGIGYLRYRSTPPQPSPTAGLGWLRQLSRLLRAASAFLGTVGRQLASRGARVAVLAAAIFALSLSLPQHSLADEPGTPSAAEAAEAEGDAPEDGSHGSDAHGADAHGSDAHGAAPATAEGPLLSFENLLNLVVLLFLQAVLGFDNLLYISIESQRAPAKDQARVRRNGIIIAIVLRIVLLFVMISLLDRLAAPFWSFQWEGVLTGSVNFASVVFLFGGCFLMYTAVKEISHMLTIDEIGHDVQKKSKKTTTQVLFMIVFMNLIFSFDSILSALAITRVFVVLAIAIVLSGLFMLLLADSVSEFLKKNRKYEVLGMFILLIVGIVLLGETGQAAAHAMHDPSLALKVFGAEIVPMSKSTFYFSLVVLVAVDILQTGYQKKLAHERIHQKSHA